MRSSQGHSRTDRSSKISITGARLSVDGTYVDRPMGMDPMGMDPAVTERSLQRRRILDELINTEEGYIGDVRFLMNVSYSFPCYKSRLSWNGTLGLRYHPCFLAFPLDRAPILYQSQLDRNRGTPRRNPRWLASRRTTL